MSSNKNRDISDNELYTAQRINNFVKDFKAAMKKKISHDLGKYLVWAIPASVLLMVYFASGQFILLALSLGCFSMPSIIKFIKEAKEDIKSLKNLNYVPKTGFEEVDDVLSMDLTKKPQDFCREDIKEVLADPSTISDDERKYYDAVRKQKEEHIKNMKSKRALEIAILDDFAQRLACFDLVLHIEEEDFKRIFDSIYSYLEAQNKTDMYYELLDIIMRTVVQNALAIENKNVTLDNFTSSFKFLLEVGAVSDFKRIDVLFQEINEIIKEQRSVSKTTPQKGKVIQFKPKTGK